MKFAVIGGDMRQVKLAELLAEDKHAVSTFAIDKIKPSGGAVSKKLPEEALLGADCVVLPLPVLGKDDNLNGPFSNTVHTIEEIFAALRPNQTVCAGRVSGSLYELAAVYGISLIDYFAREEMMVANAVATAEGAIQLAMEEIPITLNRARCLVIGFGRIGKLLSHRLRGLGAYVSVSARNYADMSWIQGYGYEAEDTGKLEGRLSDFDVIFNTVPARVLGEARLQELKPGCLCMDLASKPGGMDFTAASRLGVKAIWALSLPGEVAPVTSGAIIRDTIYNILSEQGVKV